MTGGHYGDTTSIILDGPVLAANLKLAIDNIDETVYLERTGGATRDLLRFGAYETVALVSDVLTPTKSLVIIAAESGTADTVKTINMPADCEILIIKADAGDTITVAHNFGGGNIRLSGGADTVLTGDKHMIMVRDSTLCVDLTSATQALPVQQAGVAFMNAATLDFRNASLVNAGGGVASIYESRPDLCEGRISGTSGDPWDLADTTTSQLFYIPTEGERISLYNGTIWKPYTFAETGMAIFVAQTGTRTSGSPIITAGGSWGNPLKGMPVTGTGIPGGTTVLDVSGSTLTLSANASSSGSNTVTVGGSSGNVYDLFAYINGSDAVDFEAGKWTNGTTRAVSLTKQNNILGKSSGQKRYLGSFRITAGGTMTIGGRSHNIYNHYNKRQRTLRVVDTGDSLTNATAAWRSYLNNANNNIEILLGVAEALIRAENHGLGATSSVAGGLGVGVDSSTVNSAQIMTGNFGSSVPTAGVAIYAGAPGVGSRVIHQLEYGGTGMTFYGDNNKVFNQAGLLVTYDC